MSVVSMLNSSGWEAFTLPYGAKFPPPKGWTGSSADVSEDMLYEEIDKELSETVNIAVRIPEGVVGIDIDNGELTEAQKVMAASLPSWRVSSSDGLERFTAFFSLPEGVSSDDLKNIEGVDLITREHRYTVVSGLHPKGNQYKLFSPANKSVPLSLLPEPSDLPYLPAEVIEVMKRVEEKPQKQKTKTNKTETNNETLTPMVFEGFSCDVVKKAYLKGRELMVSEGRAQGLMKAAYALYSLGLKGHSVGAVPALLLNDFISLAGEGRRKEGERLISIITDLGGSCSCSSSSEQSFYISADLLKITGLSRDEVEAEVFIKEGRCVFDPEMKHHMRAWREKTADNFLKDELAKQTNRRRAESLYSADRIYNDEQDISKLRFLVEGLSENETEKRILFLIGLGFSSLEIAEKLNTSRSKIERIKRKIRERVK